MIAAIGGARLIASTSVPTLDRQRGSHRTYTGVVKGEARVVVVACHRESDDITRGTLTAQTPIPPLNASSGHGHRELVALPIVATQVRGMRVLGT
jgi:hypothetical protein